MAISNGILITDVMHARSRPKANRFRYKVFYLCVPLDALKDMCCGVLSLGGFNLFSFHESDHGDGKTPLEPWVRGVLAQWGAKGADGRIVMVTLPRLLGYAFNPVTFYFCLDAAGGLRAVISEVNNTFGDRHCYISFHDDGRVITQDDILTTQKLMHVSPYCEVKGHYQFRFAYREEKIGVWIDYHDDEGLLLTTAMVGKRVPLSSGQLLGCFFRYPLITVKVIGLIHYQALKLFLKGIRYRTRPTPPQTEISR
ncbi:MAG: DUF1365 domain-containing protein [Proteobacteria bacterium]|nr:DUF1365 domain-containing protein [Pseudomonadota bacterium]